MATKTTIPSPIWEKTTQWIRECLEMDLPAGRPFISPKAKHGINELLKRARTAKSGDSIVLGLSTANATELMDQMNVWGYESHRLPEEYRRTMPRYGISGVFRDISAQLEGAIDDADRGR